MAIPIEQSQAIHADHINKPNMVKEYADIEAKFIELRRHALRLSDQIAKVLDIETCKDCGKKQKI